jgi:hypothetical protein
MSSTAPSGGRHELRLPRPKAVAVDTNERRINPAFACRAREIRNRIRKRDGQSGVRSTRARIFSKIPLGSGGDDAELGSLTVGTWAYLILGVTLIFS